MSGDPTSEELAAERRRLLAKARRHERRADRMPRLMRPLRAVTTALLRADLQATTRACLQTDEVERDEPDYHPRAWRRR